MTKTYCTACACYYMKQPSSSRTIRFCKHPEGPGKLDSPRTPSTCPLTIKHSVIWENSRHFVPVHVYLSPDSIKYSVEAPNG